MADFLLVPDAGKGSWCWGRVWGHLTAPSEHPPRLYARNSVGKVAVLELPTRGPLVDGEVTALTTDYCVSSLVEEARSRGLRDLVMVGQGMAAAVVLQAAAQMDPPPKRVVLLAGVIPDEGRSVLDMLPRVNRRKFKTPTRLSRKARKEFRLPKSVITSVYCNDLDSFDVVQVVGLFGPVPMEILKSRTFLGELPRNVPVTYVPLWRDRLVPLSLQRRMAERRPEIEVVGELDSCHEVTIERPKQVADILLRYA